MSSLLVKWLLIGGAVVALGWWVHHAIAVHDAAIFQRGVAAGQAQDKADYDVALKTAREQAARDEKSRQDRNKEIVDGLQSKLDNTVADNRKLAGQLRDAYSRASRSAVPPVADQPGPVGTGGEHPDPNAITEALADHLGACQRDALRLDALDAEVRAQL